MGGGERDALPTLLRLRSFYAESTLPLPPVVILTGETAPEALEAFAEAGAARVLRKPASIETLRTLVQLVSESARGRQMRKPSGGVPL